MCLEDCGNKLTRRNFLAAAAGAALGGAALGSALSAQTKPKDKEDEILQELVEFKNGNDTIQAYLAHPAKSGKRPSVLVMHGNLGVSEDIRHTAVRLARAGYVGLAVSSTSRENDDMSRLSQDFVMSDGFMRRYISDGQAGIEFLKKKSLYDDKGFGVLGYCGGGITATRFAAAERSVRAVVAFYASPWRYEPRISKTDPRPPMLDYIQQVKVPIQFHYGTNDALIPNEDIVKLREKIKAAGRKPEIYIYEGARHGFANMTDDTYHAEYAALAEKRWKKFLRKHL